MNISKDIIIVIVIIIIFISILLCFTYFSCKLNSTDNNLNNFNSTHFDIIMNNQSISNDTKVQENIDNLSVIAVKNLQVSNNNIYPS